MPDEAKAAVMRSLYDIQFHGDCTNVTTKNMWSSGWGADFGNVLDGLVYALQTKKPFQVLDRKWWHYAALKKDGSNPTCPLRNMYCYFLNMTNCAPNPQHVQNGFLTRHGEHQHDGKNSFLLDYAWRQQMWLRRRVYELTRSVNITTPCTVIHVRRGDVVLSKATSRRYYAISEYINATNNIEKNILLLTDDVDAIEEAQVEFPKFNWMFINRTRNRGSEGGWENQLPSQDPTLEVVVLSGHLQACKTVLFVDSHPEWLC